MPELVAGWQIDAPTAGVFLLSPAEGEAALVARATTGPVDLGGVAALAGVDPAGLDGGSRVDLIMALERAKAALDAAQQRALAAVVEATEDCGLDGDFARHEVGAALRLSPGTAYERTQVAADLITRLPDTLAALGAGAISYWQARSIAVAVRDLPDPLAVEVAARVLAGAGTQTAAETYRALEREVLAVDPTGAAARHRKARSQRRVSLTPQPDAMSGLWATLTAVDAAHVWTTLTAQARRAKTRLRNTGVEDPGIDALRSDTLVALLTGRPLPGHGDSTTQPASGAPAGGSEAGGDPGVQGGPFGEAGGEAHVAPDSHHGAAAGPGCGCGGRPTVGVVVDLATLLHLAEHPAELPGHGPIPATLARELAADADWVRWTVDGGTRRLLDLGADRYRPGARLARHVAAEHGVCGFPGCNRAAEHCDLDHVVEHRVGGKTTRINLGPLCRQHHNAKTHGGWLLTYDDDTGVKTWTSPLGKTYLKGPKRYPPDG